MVNQWSAFPGLSFRHIQGETDYTLMLSIVNASDRADQISENTSIDDIKHWCASSNRFDPAMDLLFAQSTNPAGERTTVGFSRLSWYTGMEGARLYDQTSFLHPDWRQHGLWSVMVRQNERRLREIAASHPENPRRFYQGWATSTQERWISVLKSEGYLAVRHFNNMLYKLGDVSDRALPAGLEIRPVQPDHFRAIWEAQREVVLGLFEVVVESWSEDGYKRWINNHSHTPQLW